MFIRWIKYRKESGNRQSEKGQTLQNQLFGDKLNLQNDPVQQREMIL